MSTSRQLAAIMFTDIVGYTALMGNSERRAFELLRKNRALQKPLVEQHGGRWLKEIGDGVLASFNTVTDAVNCARAIQDACRKEPDMSLRIGIHQGEVVFEGNDVFGDGVNIASRLEPLAPAGGIVVSESVQRNVINKDDFDCVYLGEKALKNVRHPVRVYQLVTEGTANRSSDQQTNGKPKPSRLKIAVSALAVLLVISMSYFLWPNLSTRESDPTLRTEVIDKSIAVLPFVDMSPQKDQEYFSDGMAEEIINALAQIPDLKVASRTSAFQYRDEEKDIKSIGDALGVATVLEGSIRKSNDKIRITAQLINAEDGFHIWSETYDRKMDDVFAIQDEISNAIVEELQIKISAGTHLVEVSTSNIEAYNLFLEGRYYLNKRSEAGMRQSIELFNQVLALDSNYSLAYTGLADAYNNLGVWGYMEANEAFPLANRAALDAIALDASMGQAYAALAYGQMYYYWDWDAAEKNFKTAIELNPDYATAYRWYALFLAIMGQHDRAVAVVSKALELEPLTSINVFNMAQNYMWNGEYDQALKQADRLIALDPEFQPIDLLLYRIYFYLQQDDNAFSHYVNWSARYMSDTRPMYEAYQASGWKGVAHVLQQHIQPESPVYETMMAESYIFMGDHEKAIDFLNQAYKRKIPTVVQLTVEPKFIPLYENPRFKKLVNQLELPQSAI